MKTKLLFLLLVFCKLTLISQIAYQPSNLQICDDDLDGDDSNGLVQNIDLESVTAQILGDQNPSLFSVSFYLSQSDADSFTNQLVSPFQNTNTTQTIYARVTENSTGKYAITSFYITVNILPDFDISSEFIICLNNLPLIISVQNPIDSYSYRWTDSLGSTIGNLDSVEMVKGGIYTVRATDPITGCIKTKTIEVIESNIATISKNDLIIIEDSNNNSVTLNTTNIGSGFYEYAIVDAQNNIVYPYQNTAFFENLQSGEYKFLVRDKNGCGTTSLDFSIGKNTVSINEFNEIQFTIYPNPIKNNFFIRLENKVVSDLNIKIYDIKGRLVSNTVDFVNYKKLKVNLSPLSNGIYFLRIKSDEKTATKKIIISSSN